VYFEERDATRQCRRRIKETHDDKREEQAKEQQACDKNSLSRWQSVDGWLRVRHLHPAVHNLLPVLLHHPNLTILISMTPISRSVQVQNLMRYKLAVMAFVLAQLAQTRQIPHTPISVSTNT
jgi:hypothetical protein